MNNQWSQSPNPAQQPQQSYTRTPGMASGYAQPQLRRCPQGQIWDANLQQCKPSMTGAIPRSMPPTGQVVSQPQQVSQVPQQYNARPQPVQQPLQSPYMQQTLASNVQNRIPQMPQQQPYSNNTQFLLNDIRRFFPNRG